MKTLLLKNNENDIKKAANLINQGKVVAIPTETVYGLAADALNGNAVKNIFKAKGRPMDNPLIVHIDSIDSIHKYNLVSDFPKKAKKLAKAFWPGPLTIIMNKTNVIPKEVSCNLNTVGIRYPNNETALKIIKYANTPLAAPSANVSGSPSPTSAKHVFTDLNGKIDAIVDGGISTIGLESTVISLVEDTPRLLRPGGVTLEELESVIGKVVVDQSILKDTTNTIAPSSPGMKYKHYSPKANVILLKGTSSSFIKYVNQNYNEDTATICFKEDLNKIKGKTFCLGGKENYEEQAYNLFNALREIDKINNIETVFAHCPSTKGMGMAVYNRLIRAAGFEVKSLA